MYTVSEMRFNIVTCFCFVLLILWNNCYCTVIFVPLAVAHLRNDDRIYADTGNPVRVSKIKVRGCGKNPNCTKNLLSISVSIHIPRRYREPTKRK